ncbi:hypothetical protein RRG08_044716 [Elysia crispata]|uniref:Uncharacterized protein n=1 Tax=Elysia crispata TaxID=231223 RepID=A0AAE0XWU8_9GAST|nr:hypothetical protein RRG08_044716 [Elysia crispata]
MNIERGDKFSVGDPICYPGLSVVARILWTQYSSVADTTVPLALTVGACTMEGVFLGWRYLPAPVKRLPDPFGLDLGLFACRYARSERATQLLLRMSDINQKTDQFISGALKLVLGSVV